MGRGQVGDVFASPDPWSSPGRFLMDVASSTCFANFHEKFWKHGRTNVAAITVFRGGVVQHSGFYEILIRQLVAKCHTVNSSENPIPVVCTWDSFLSVIAKTHDHKWGSEQGPVQILTALRSLKAPVLSPQSDRAYAELRLLCQFIYQSLSFVFRHSQISPQGSWISPLASAEVFFHLLASRTVCVSGETWC